jgi:hypothetical protein
VGLELVEEAILVRQQRLEPTHLFSCPGFVSRQPDYCPITDVSASDTCG